MKIIEVPFEPISYDTELDALLQGALANGLEKIELVAECLWVYVNPKRKVARREAAARFEELLRERVPARDNVDSRRLPDWDRDRMVPLNAGFAQPMAMPMFIRAFAPAVVSAVTFGDLMFKVWLYLDWERFATIINDSGGHFAWGSKKDTARARAMPRRLRPPIFAGRVPVIDCDGVRASVSDPSVVQMLYDGVTPRTIAKSIMEMARQSKTDHA